MPLRRLHEVYDRIEGLEPPHHRRRPVPWLIALDGQGRFLGFVPTTGDGGKAKTFCVPYARRSGTKPPPYLLADVPACVLGLGQDKLTPEQAAERHAAFRALVGECAAACDAPEPRAVATFLREGVEAARRQAPETLKPGDVLAFQVGETVVTDLPEVRAFWQRTQEEPADTGGLQAECLLCGQVRPIVQSHPVELHLGADRVQFVTANEDAFESYGLERSEIAPVCAACALRYGQAADHLMTSDEHHTRIGGLHYIYWTQSGGTGDVFALFEKPQPEQVQRLLTSVFAPSHRSATGADAFYVLAATANQSRLIVRDWLETSLAEAERNLARYFELQALAMPDGQAFEPVGVGPLVLGLVREAKDLSPHAVPALLGAALRGRPLPIWLLHQAVRRAHGDTDHRVTRPRAMLVKMVLNSLPETERSVPMVQESLDLSNRHPAYLCGRLLAVLEAVQRAALGKVNATIVDRFFATASSAPASVFGRLMRGAQPHMAKLRRDRPGTHAALQERIEEVTVGLQGFPTVLDLTAQGLFMLGYYHQRADDRRQMAERVAARKAAGMAVEDDELVADLSD